jgi:predicted permease
MFLRIFTSVCLPIILLAGTGWALDRFLRLDLRTLVKLNIQLFVPAFLFVRIATSNLDLLSGLQVVGFTLAMLFLLGVLSFWLARASGWSKAVRKALQMSTMFYNCGNFGIPVMTLAFPGTGPVIQAFVLMTMNLTTFSAGVMLAHAEPVPGAPSRWWTVLRQPSLFAIALALLIKGLGATAALQSVDAIWKPVQFLADGLVPVALLTLGVQLSQTPPLQFRGPLLAAVAMRLIGGPLLAWALVSLAHIASPIGAILIAGAAAPTAINAAMLVHEYGDGDDEAGFVAAAVFASTLFSALTVTVVLTLLRWGGF